MTLEGIKDWSNNNSGFIALVTLLISLPIPIIAIIR